MSSKRRHYVPGCPLGMAVFFAAFMLVTTARAPAEAVASGLQHAIHSQAGHANQPCLDSTSFDWTVSQTTFSLVSLPRCTRPVLRPDATCDSPGPSEFRLYNRPPPLS